MLSGGQRNGWLRPPWHQRSHARRGERGIGCLVLEVAVHRVCEPLRRHVRPVLLPPKGPLPERLELPALPLRPREAQAEEQEEGQGKAGPGRLGRDAVRVGRRLLARDALGCRAQRLRRLAPRPGLWRLRPPAAAAAAADPSPSAFATATPATTATGPASAAAAATADPSSPALATGASVAATVASTFASVAAAVDAKASAGA
mmetsp:Transcript_44573/g.127667  ORF Transcript_44573/g.127667 Transcript_44573/m.127667 type:complete len:203 (+) Transcript_44573:230-838(+)